jgi:hypothetical protein
LNGSKIIEKGSAGPTTLIEAIDPADRRTASMKTKEPPGRFQLARRS